MGQQTWFPGGEKTQVQVKKENAGLEDLNLGVGIHIREIRLKQGMTQKELADKMKVSRTFITNCEGGNQTISLKRLYQFAEALDCEVSVELRKKR